MTLTLTLPSGEFVYTGKQVTFTAPCESEGLTGVIVDGITYDLVSAMGTTLVANSFDTGAIVSVIFNAGKKKAYVQNADTNAYLEGRLDNKAELDEDGKVPASQLPPMDYAPMYTYGTADITAGSSPLETGKLYFVYE